MAGLRLGWPLSRRGWGLPVALLVFATTCTHHPAAVRPTPTLSTFLGQLEALAKNAPNAPSVEPRGSCPISLGHELNTHAFGGYALGTGPAYPIMVADQNASGTFVTGIDQTHNPGWGQLKTLWALSPKVSPPFLVRVIRLDGTGGIGVSGGDPVSTTFTSTGDYSLSTAEIFNRSNNIDPVDHWPSYPSAVFIRQPGCYAFQVDGRGFTYQLVFAARP